MEELLKYSIENLVLYTLANDTFCRAIATTNHFLEPLEKWFLSCTGVAEFNPRAELVCSGRA